MKIIDLTCPNCGGVLEKKEELENLDIGYHELECNYCGYVGLLEKTDEDKIDLKDIEDKSYAKARGEYRARNKSYREGLIQKIVIFGVIGLIVVALAVISIKMQERRKLEVDPFEYVDLGFSGTNGEGKAQIEQIPPPEDSELRLSRINYTLDEYSNELYNGDVVTVVADSSEYNLTKTTKQFKVTGLDKYLKSIDQLDESVIESFNSLTSAYVDEQLNGKLDEGSEVVKEPAGLFLITNNKDENALYDIFKVDINHIDGRTTTFYLGKIFYDVVVRDDLGKSVDYGYTWSRSNSTVRIEAVDALGGYLFGYVTLEEARADAMSSKKSDMDFDEYIY